MGIIQAWENTAFELFTQDPLPTACGVFVIADGHALAIKADFCRLKELVKTFRRLRPLLTHKCGSVHI